MSLPRIINHRNRSSITTMFLLVFLASTIQNNSVLLPSCEAAAAAAAAASLSTKRTDLLSNASSSSTFQQQQAPQQQQHQEQVLSRTKTIKTNPKQSSSSNRTSTSSSIARTSSSSSSSSNTKTLPLSPPSTTSTTTSTPTTKYLITLSYLSGISDIICHTKYDCYASMMTGNLINLITSFIERQYNQVVKFGLLIGCYMTGVAFFRTRMEKQSHGSNGGARVSMIVVLGLFVCSDTIDYLYQNTLSSSVLMSLFSLTRAPLLSIAHGIINAASTECITPGTITFAMTGHITKIGHFTADFYNHYFLTKNNKKKQRKLKMKKATKISMIVITSFICGIGSATLFSILLDYSSSSLSSSSLGTNSILTASSTKLYTSSSSSSILVFAKIILQKISTLPPFVMIGCIYSIILHFGMSAYSQQQLQLQQQEEQETQFKKKMQNKEQEVLDPYGITYPSNNKKRRKQQQQQRMVSNKDSRMDGWTNMPKGPRPFQDHA